MRSYKSTFIFGGTWLTPLNEIRKAESIKSTTTNPKVLVVIFILLVLVSFSMASTFAQDGTNHYQLNKTDSIFIDKMVQEFFNGKYDALPEKSSFGQIQIGYKNGICATILGIEIPKKLLTSIYFEWEAGIVNSFADDSIMFTDLQLGLRKYTSYKRKSAFFLGVGPTLGAKYMPLENKYYDFFGVNSSIGFDTMLNQRFRVVLKATVINTSDVFIGIGLRGHILNK
jgi:hypothetical protein